MAAKNDLLTNEALFNTVSSEAEGLYKVIIAVASSFLGGSLLFVEKISSKPILVSLLFLILGWIFLIISMISVPFIRYQNIKSLNFAGSKNFEEMKRSVTLAKKLSILSIIFLTIGITSIMVFGAINILAKYF